MKIDKQDWKKLRVSLMVLLLAILIGLLLCAWAYNYGNAQQQALQAQQDSLSSAKQRYLSSGMEKQVITEYLPGYKNLISKGFVGEERRIEWVDELRRQHKNFKLFSIKYSIGLEAPYKPSFVTSMGGFVLNRSVMTLELDMLHEEDLLQLTEQLSPKNEKDFILRDCEMTRLNSTGNIGKQLVANLHAKCDLDWLTLREPSNVQAVTPQ